MTQQNDRLDRLEPIDEVSKRLAVSTFTVRRLIKAKQLRAIRVGKRVLISDTEIERVIREGTGPTREERR